MSITAAAAPVRELVQHPLAHLVPEMRAEEYAQFLEDIRKRGVTDPLHIHDGYTVLDGRTRLRAARELGLAMVPVVEAHFAEGESPVVYMMQRALARRHLSDDQRAVLGVAIQEQLSAGAVHNRGRKPADKLSGTLPDNLSEQGPEPASESEKPRRDTRREAAQAVGLPPESRKLRDAQTLKNKAPELLPKVAAGELTMKEANREIRKREREERVEKMEKKAQEIRSTSEPLGRFISGNSLALLDPACADVIHPAAPDLGTFDLVFTDPPYARSKSHIGHTERKSIDTDFGEWDGQWSCGWVRLLPRLLNVDTGQALIFCPGEAIGELERELTEAGLIYRGYIVWHKSNPGTLHRKGYLSSCECIVWATASGADQYHLTEPANAGSTEVHNFRTGPICQGHERLDHPTQKPLWLIQDLLERHALPGHRVLDPFAGVATTLVACEKHGCNYVGIELDPGFHRHGMARLARCEMPNNGGQIETRPDLPRDMARMLTILALVQKGRKKSPILDQVQEGCTRDIAESDFDFLDRSGLIRFAGGKGWKLAAGQVETRGEDDRLYRIIVDGNQCISIAPCEAQP